MMILSTIVVSAQPTYNASNAPSPGQSFNFIEGTYVEFSNMGANQTWNAGNVTQTGEGTQAYATPAGSAVADQFPNATHRLLLGVQEQFMEYNASGAFVLGAYSQNTLISCQPMKVIQFPLSMGTSWTATSQCNWTQQGTPYSSTANTQNTVTGHGTLILPYGSITNVLCLTTTNTTNMLIGTQQYVEQSTIQFFYKPGVPTYVAMASTAVATIDGFPVASDEEINYMAEGSIGLQEWIAQQIGMDLFPNPSTGNILINVGAAGELMLEILDAQGRKVMTRGLGTHGFGIHQFDLDLSSLPAGVYLVHVTNEQGERGTKRLVLE